MVHLIFIFFSTHNNLVKEPTKLVINQIDPTSVCGNGCRHCGDNSTLRGSVLPLEDIDRLLGSNLFDLPFEGFCCEENLPRLLSRGYGINNTKNVYLGGNGDPTFYLDGNANFADLIGVISKYASTVRFWTGGLNPELSVEDLIRAKKLMANYCKGGGYLIGAVSHHPFGGHGHEERIKRTLEIFRDALLRDLMLKVICLPQDIVSLMPPETRATFPFLTSEEFQTSSLHSWILERFRDEVHVLYEFLNAFEGEGTFTPSVNPLIAIIFRVQLRNTGRAKCLPHNLAKFFCDNFRISRKEIEEFYEKIAEIGIFNSLRVTPEGFITGCDSSRFERPEFYEADLYGHSYGDVLQNRRLFLEHLARSSKEWLDRGESEKRGDLCDDVCKTARERFAADARRIKSHRGQGETVLLVRKKLFAVA